MEHNTDRILWTVLILAIGVALFVIFKPQATTLLNQVTDKITDVVNGVDVTAPTSAIFLPFF